MITSTIAEEVKKYLKEVTEQKMYHLMLRHYRLLNVINENGDWILPELQNATNELLSNDSQRKM